MKTSIETLRLGAQQTLDELFAQRLIPFALSVRAVESLGLEEYIRSFSRCSATFGRCFLAGRPLLRRNGPSCRIGPGVQTQLSRTKRGPCTPPTRAKHALKLSELAHFARLPPMSQSPSIPNILSVMLIRRLKPFCFGAPTPSASHFRSYSGVPYSRRRAGRPCSSC